ncbi:MAG TPA: hypothetical protein VK120_00365 [Sporosarcina sp.]|nr:hypothetical protein [Sporosarcina sp.]
MKFIRSIIGAQVLFLFVFAFLPALMFKPDIEIIQSLLQYITKES